MEQINVVVEKRVSKKTGNEYEVCVIKLPNKIDIPVFGLGAVELQLIKQYSTPVTFK